MATQQSCPASDLWPSASDFEPEDGNWRGLGPAAGSPFRSPGLHLQKSWMDDDRWKPGKFLDWGGGAGVMGGVAERGRERSWMGAQERSPFQLDSIFRRSPVREKTFTWSPDSRHVSLCRSPPTEVTPRGRSSGGGEGPTVSASYGSKFWTGQERKRGSGDAAAALEQEADRREFESDSLSRWEKRWEKKVKENCFLSPQCWRH